VLGPRVLVRVLARARVPVQVRVRVPVQVQVRVLEPAPLSESVRAPSG
jgi:hypothetical protein